MSPACQPFYSGSNNPERSIIVAVISDTGRSGRPASRTAFLVAGAACALLSWASPADETVPAKPTFTESEIKQILSHGPWGGFAPPDPTNRASGNRQAIELGMHLFEPEPPWTTVGPDPDENRMERS